MEQHLDIPKASCVKFCLSNAQCIMAKRKMGRFAHTGGADTWPLRAAAACDMLDKGCLVLLAGLPMVCPCKSALAAFSLSHAVVDMLGLVSNKKA